MNDVRILFGIRKNLFVRVTKNGWDGVGIIHWLRVNSEMMSDIYINTATIGLLAVLIKG